MDKSRADFEAWATDVTNSEGNAGAFDLYCWDAWQASRKQVLEEALAACNRQTIEAVAPLSSRFLYRSAIADCIDAIRSLEGNATKETT